jgi:hypothetical protein
LPNTFFKPSKATDMHKPYQLLPVFIITLSLLSCNDQAKSDKESNGKSETNKTHAKNASSYKEGIDYLVYHRVRILDKIGFTEPAEAYSLLLPKGWQNQSDIIWNQPGSSCAGTFKWLKANSADNKYSLEMYPDILYQWNTNQEVMQFNQDNNSSSNCKNRQPVDAENYLRNIFVNEELGNPEIIKVEPNQEVVRQMQQMNAASMRELQQYGAGQMQFDQTAVNAVVRWPDSTEGLVVLGVTVIETAVPNVYNGTYDKIYTTQVAKRTLFKYPVKESEQAKHQFSVIMSSFRSNPAWNDAVNNFWKAVRQQKNTDHIGRIQIMDEQTRRMGEEAIRKGNERLKSMDNDMRSWEANQSSQDRIHTNFIKTIREVENYRDETGKYEISSSYTNAWSRGDGTSFVMSNNSNFNPSFVFQDQAWKEMKKADD